MIANGRIQLYPVMRLALMLALGIVVGDAVCPWVSIWAWVLAVGIIVVVALCLSRYAMAQSCLLMVAVFLLGCSFVCVELHRLSPVITDELEEYEAVVMTPPIAHGQTVRCVLLVSKGRLAGHRVRASFLLSPRDERAAALRVGDGVVASSHFEEPCTQKSSSSHFDYVRWLKVQGVSATTFLGYNVWHRALIDLSDIAVFDKVRLWAARFRDNIVRRSLSSSLSGQTLAVATAMALGDKSQLSAETKEAYSVSGASHLLALSGLHLGIIYAVLSFVLVHRRRPWMGRMVVIMALWTYVVIVGMMPSVVRSATMFTFYAVASMFRRPQLSLNAWAFAAFFILLVSPLSIWDVGFQLSFMAVAGIIVFYRPLYGIVDGEWLMLHRLFKSVWSVVVLSFSAQLAVAPLVAYHFGKLSCYFLFSNLIAVPLASLVLYASLLALVLTPLPWLHSLVIGCVDVFVKWLNTILLWFSHLPGASIDDIRINSVQVVLIYAFMACLYFLVRYVARFHRSAHGLRRGQYN